MNPESKQVDLRADNQLKLCGKAIVSSLVTLVVICMVIFGAFMASLIRYHDLPPLCHENADILDSGTMLCKRCQYPFVAQDQIIANSTDSLNSTNLTNQTPEKKVSDNQAFRNAWLRNRKMTLAPKVHTVNWELVGEQRVYTTKYGEDSESFILVDGSNCQSSVAQCESSDSCRPFNYTGTIEWNDGYPPSSSLLQKNQWKWASAALNAMLIVIFGRLYESIAVSMNDWENHRTQTEYDDQLIFKNFVFQFVNNYFILFYIAYLLHSINISRILI